MHSKFHVQQYLLLI